MIKRKLVKFGASWCAPCNMASKMLKSFDPELVQEVDITKDAELAEQYGIKNIPTFVLINANGDEIDRFNGFNAKSLKEAIDKIS